MKKSKILSGIMAFALAVTTFATPLAENIVPSNTIVASANTEGVQIPGDGGTGGGGIVPPWSTKQDNIVLRIYLAKGDTVFTNRFSDLTINSELTNETLHKYAKYGVYGISGTGADGIAKKLTIANSTWKYSYTNSEGGTSTSYCVQRYKNKKGEWHNDRTTIPQSMIVTTDSAKFDFSSCFNNGDDVDTLANFSTCAYNNSKKRYESNFDGKALSDWSDGVFKGEGKTNPADADARVAHFVEKLYTKAKDAWGNIPSELPKNYNEFVGKGWVIVVEPMFPYHNDGDTNADFCAWSYQDLVHAEPSGNHQFTTYWWMVNEADHTAKLSGFWPMYPSMDGKTLDYKGTDDVGFGFYWGNHRYGGVAVNETFNYNLYNKGTNYKFDSMLAATKSYEGVTTNFGGTLTTVSDSVTLTKFTDSSKVKFDALLSTAWDLQAKKSSDNKVTAPIYHSLGKDNAVWSGVTYATQATPSNNTQGFQFNTGISPKGSSDNTTNYKTPAGKNITAFDGDVLGDDNYYIVSSNDLLFTFGAAYTGSKKYADIKSAALSAASSVQDNFVTALKPMALQNADSSNLYNFGMSFKGDIYRKDKVTNTGVSFTGSSAVRAGLGGGNLDVDGKRNGVGEAVAVKMRQALGSNAITYSAYTWDKSEELYDNSHTTNDNTKINNAIGNTAAAARSASKVFVNNQTDYSLIGEAKVGVSLNYLAKDKNVTSYVQVWEKDKNGNITDKTSAYVGKTSTTYSMRSSDSFTINRADTDGTCFMLVIPNSAEVVSNGKSLSTNLGIKYYRDLLAADNRNSYDGAKRLAAKVRSDITSFYAGDGGVWNSGKNILHFFPDNVKSNTIGVGAVGNTVKYNSGVHDTDVTGYNVVILIDKTEVKPQEVWADVDAYRVNMIYPNMHGNISLTTQKEGKAARYVYIANSLNSEVAVSKHTTDYKGLILDKQKSLVSNGKTPIVFYNNGSSTVNGKVMYYPFDIESKNPKTWTSEQLATIASKGQYITCTHSFDLNKSLFSDNLVVSSLNRTNQSIANTHKSYLADSLSLGFDMTPVTRASGTTGRTTQIGGERKDYWFWSATASGANYRLPDGSTHKFSPFYYGEDENRAGYNMHELAYKYTPQNIGKGPVMGSKTPTKYSAGLNYTLTTVEALGQDIKYYPDVAMLVDLPDGNYTTGKSPSATTTFLYVLGEKLRTVDSAGMYTMRLTNSAGKSGNTVDTSKLFSGTTQSASVATGSDAKKLAQDMGNSKASVIYAGADIQTTISSDVGVEFYGFVLDLADKDIDSTIYTGDTSVTGANFLKGIDNKTFDLQDAWNDGLTSKGKDKFETWVQNVKKSMYVSPELETTKKNNSHVATYTFGTESLYQGSSSSATAMYSASYNIKISNGAVVKDGAYSKLLTEIANVYSCSTAEAETRLNNSGILQALIKSLETSAVTNADSVGKFGGKWYDEKANYFVIREYKSTADLFPGKGNSKVVNAKLDITSGPAQETNGKLFQNGYNANWRVTIGFDNKSIYGGNKVYDGKDANDKSGVNNVGGIALMDIAVNGASFIIPDATTADMNR